MEKWLDCGWIDLSHGHSHSLRHSHSHSLSHSHSHSHTPIHEGIHTGGAARSAAPPVWRRREAPPPSWMGVWLRLWLWLRLRWLRGVAKMITT